MESDDEIFQHLLLSGALEVSGIDIETGEFLYNFTNKLKDVNPVLHDEFTNYFYQEAVALWENGFLDMDITSINPTVKITPKALDPEQISKLDKEKQYTLKEIIRVLLDSNQ